MTRDTCRSFMFCLLFTMSFIVKAWAFVPQEDGKWNRLTEHDFIDMYQSLNKNIEAFNKLNETLLGEYAQKEWVETYLIRAQKTYDLGQETQKPIDNLMSKLKNPACADDFERIILTTDLINSAAVHDVFLMEDLLERACNLMEPLKYKDTLHMEKFMKLAYNLAELKQIVSVSGDEGSFRKCYEIHKDLIEHYVPGRDVVKTPSTVDTHMRAYAYLLGHKEFVSRGVTTLEEYETWLKEFVGYMNDSLYVSVLPENHYKLFVSTVSRYDIGMIRSVFLPDTTHRYDKVRDEMLQLYVDHFDQHRELEEKLSLADKRRLNIMRERIGRISNEEALKNSNHYLEILSKQLSENATKKGANDMLMGDKVNCILECVYFVDVSKLSDTEKHDAVKKYCDEILDDMQHLRYNNNNPNVVRSLSHAATYPRIHRYLTSNETKVFLETLLFFSQPYTRAHSETVAHLALTLFDGVVKYEPELLVGLMGYKSVREVRKNRNQIKDFFMNAALYHDLGKTRMPDIIRNEYRKLTDHEFAIIKLHPELGAKMMDVDPELMKYKDIALGHQKWYNGKGGYPASFDNTQSPYRVLIDILTLADCLEAATSKLGRNYRKNKKYDDVLKEFQADAGTRYNPDLVDFLVSHPKFGEKLSYICDKGWEDVYYHVFMSNGARGTISSH